MDCKHCNHTLPDDSRFCQYCGKTVDAPEPAPAPKPTPPRIHTAPATKTVFCRLCGKPIDNETKQCTGCGKQYFRGIRPMTFLCIVMTLAILILATLSIVQELRYQERIEELEEIIISYETKQ